jgi:hypothetical protein
VLPVGALLPCLDPVAQGATLFAAVEPAYLQLARVDADGTRHEVQENLFGVQETTRTLFAERTKVFGEAAKILKRERAAFGALLANAEIVERAGNVIDRDASAKAVSSAELVSGLVEKLATRAGPVSDALNRAAAAMAEGAPREKVARTFLADVLDIFERDGLAGLEAQPRLAPDTAIEPGSAEAKAQADTLTMDMFGAAPAAETAPARQLIGPADAVGNVRAWKAAAPFETLDQLYAGSEANQGRLAAVAETIGGDLGLTFKNPGIKDRDRSAEKMAEKGGRAGNLTDVVRGGFELAAPGQADQIVAGLARHFDVIDEGWVTNKVGYFDRKVLVKFADGQVGEVQLWEPSLLKAKSEGGGHDLYKEARALPVDDPRIAELVQKQQDLYRPLLAGLSDDWKAALGNGGSSPNRALNVASEMSADFMPSSAELPRFQEPLAKSQASPGDQSTGVSSQSPNEYVMGKASGSDIAPAGRESNPRASEITPAGEQTLIPGVAPVTERQRLEAAGAKPLAGGNAPAGGLFDTGARAQTDLMDMLPMQQGENGAIILRRDQAMAEVERADMFGDLVASCTS